MKKIIKLLFFSLFIIPLTTFSQSIYYDAVALEQLLDYNPDSNKVVIYGSNTDACKILAKYFIGSKQLNNASVGTIIRAIDKSENPYFYVDTVTMAFQSNAPAISSASILSGIGGLDVTAIADGLARFMVKRAKQELSITFFSKFKEEMENPKYSDLKILFPTTYKTLLVIDTEIYQYTAYINTLRAAFEKDLALIPHNIPLVWKQDKYKPFFDEHQEIRYVLDNVEVLSNGLLDDKHPGDVLSSVAKTSYKGNNSTVKNLESSIEVLDLFSQSLRDSSNERYWITAEQCDALRDTLLNHIYMGLIYQQSIKRNITFYKKGTPVKFAEGILKPTKDSIQPYITYINDFIIKIEPIDEKIKEIKKKNKNGEKIEYDDYYVVVDKSLDLYEHALTITELPYLKTQIAQHKWPSYCKAMVPMGKLANETVLDVSNKNYSSAILNAGLLVECVIKIMNEQDKGKKVLNGWTNKLDGIHAQVEKINLSNGRDSIPKDLATKINAFNTTISKSKILKIELKDYKITIPKVGNRNDFETLKIYLDGLGDLNDLTTSLQKYVPLFDTVVYLKLIKYGTFAASLATAENAEQAEQIIENMALPAGSARIKKHMAFSVSLNSYLGGYVGTNNFSKTRGWSYGVTGLVGVGLNIGIGRGKNPWAITFFGNIIDIGALASFRLDDNVEDYKFKIKLSQILSPGGFLIVGLPKVPLSILGGYQYAPLIKTVQNSSTMLEYDPDYNRGRFTLGIVVDIPLMHFYNKTKTYK